MPDYNKIKAACKKRRDLSEPLVDEFLVYYAAGRDRVDKEFEMRLNRFRKTSRRMDNSMIARLKAQYIAHRIFRKNGLVNKYVNHSEIKLRSPEEREYLDFAIEHPWKFSFSFIADNPADDFFEMVDVFSGEEYLMYSPGTALTLEDHRAELWFNMIAYTGDCWETYGPIQFFASLWPDDIFYFAGELDPEIENEEQVLKNIENNPLPYMMLYNYATAPPIFHKDHRVMHLFAWYNVPSFKEEEMGDDFMIEINSDVVRLALKRWNAFPHFAFAYYDRAMELMTLTALTQKGFNTLVQRLQKYGFEVEDDPHVRLNIIMSTAITQLLNNKFVMNEYDHLFDEPKVDDPVLDRINVFTGLLMECFNAGKKADIPALAKEAGIDEAEAHHLYGQIKDKFEM